MSEFRTNSQATILVVDDILMNIKYMKILLSKSGYKVLTAKNGLDALKLIENNKPDLILLDLLMPIMNGFEVLKELSKQNSEIPVVVVSAEISDSDVDKLKELGARDLIKKPVSPGFLLTKIDKIIQNILYF